MITTIILAFVLLICAIAGMALGVIVRKHKKKGELKGSCGGPEVNPDCCKQKECPRKK